jgi:site-specific recombinase XerD
MGKASSVDLIRAPRGELTPGALELLKALPEEALWLEGQQSPRTRRAYRADVAGFMAFFGISSSDELRQMDRGAVIAYRRHLEELGTRASTVRRKLAALSSLFTHLVDRQVLRENPCREIRRPKVNRREGRTPAFSKEEARAILDAPETTTVRGLRDGAILSDGFQAGPRRSSVVRLKVGDLYRERGYDALRFVWKGGHTHALALHPQTAQRIRDYLAAAGHGEDLERPLFRRVLRGEGIRRACDRERGWPGEAEGCYNLALLYESSRGVSRHLLKATPNAVPVI